VDLRATVKVAGPAFSLSNCRTACLASTSGTRIQRAAAGASSHEENKAGSGVRAVGVPLLAAPAASAGRTRITLLKEPRVDRGAALQL
jgi:hypothetical protein